MNKYISFLLLLSIFISCKSTDNTPLPIIGKKKMVDGKEVDHFIPDFSYTDQNGKTVTNKQLDDYVYVADFFYTFCPTICPTVMKQMLTIYDEFESNPKVKLVSFTLDPKRDTPEHLKQYAENLGVDHDKWLFLSGEKDATYDLAEEHFVVAYDDPDSPDGFNHSGKILLVDQNRHVRAFAEGTDPDDIPDFLDDIRKLLKEIETKAK